MVVGVLDVLDVEAIKYADLHDNPRFYSAEWGAVLGSQNIARTVWTISDLKSKC